MFTFPWQLSALTRLLLEQRCYVLLTSNATETATWLASWSSVIKDTACEKVPLDVVKKATEISDRQHGDLLACLHATGLSKEDQEIIGRQFYSLDELQAAYDKCSDVLKRQLLLAPLLLLSMDTDSQEDPAANSRAAASISNQLFQACTAQSGDTTDPTSAPEVRLSLMATAGIRKDVWFPSWYLSWPYFVIACRHHYCDWCDCFAWPFVNLIQCQHSAAKDVKSMPEAGGCSVEQCKPCCKDVEEVRVQLCGSGSFTAFKSGILHIFILNGSQLLRFLTHAWQQAMWSALKHLLFVFPEV